MEHSASRSPPGAWLAICTGTGGEEVAVSPPPVALRLQTLQRAVDGDRRRAAGVDGVDDLGVVDALEVDRGDAEVGVAELALDDDQRNALTGHLDGVRLVQLVWRKASPRAGVAGDAAQLGAGGGGGPRPPARGAVDDAKQRSDRQPNPRLRPRLRPLPGPVVHDDLAAAAALAASHQQRSAARVEVGLGKRERLADAQAGAP